MTQINIIRSMKYRKVSCMYRVSMLKGFRLYVKLTQLVYLNYDFFTILVLYFYTDANKCASQWSKGNHKRNPIANQMLFFKCVCSEIFGKPIFVKLANMVTFLFTVNKWQIYISLVINQRKQCSCQL